MKFVMLFKKKTFKMKIFVSWINNITASLLALKPIKI